MLAPSWESQSFELHAMVMFEVVGVSEYKFELHTVVLFETT